MILRTERVRKAIADAKSILHLPRLSRIVHHKARRPVAIVAIGVIVMLLGSMIAAHKDSLGHLIGVHHIIVDTIGYFIHAAGALPALRYIEPVWLVLFGVAEMEG
jgi:hypothetical protein